MTGRLSDDGGYSLIELLVVMVILSVVVGGIATLFASGHELGGRPEPPLPGAAGRPARARQAAPRGPRRPARSRRRTPTTPPSRRSRSTSRPTTARPGAHSVTWCTTGASGRFALYRIVATSCTGATTKFADYLTSGTIFTYLPPNSHLVTSTSLGQGTGSGAIVTQDLASTLPRLHVDINLELRGGLADGYRLVDDIAFRNGPRACAGGTRIVLNRLRTEESGIALVMALMTMIVLAIVSTTAIYYSTQSEHQSSYSKTSDVAYRLAEAGINNASATLGLATRQRLSARARCRRQRRRRCSQSLRERYRQVVGHATNVLSRIVDGLREGHRHEPELELVRGDASALRATIRVSPSLTQPLNAQAWNYLFVTNQGGPNVCDVSISNNVEVDASFYIMGNLCLSNNAKIVEDLATPTIPIIVSVQGKLGYSNGTSIGRSATNTVTEVHLNGGCGNTNLTSTHTCKAYPTSGFDPIYAQIFDTHGTVVTPPTIDWALLVPEREPGPQASLHHLYLAACLREHGCSLQHAAGHLGHVPERQRHDAVQPDAEPELLVRDAERLDQLERRHEDIDGERRHVHRRQRGRDEQAVNEYNGMGTIYLSGYLTVNGMMCGKRNAGNSDCDFTNWNPNTEMLIVGAHGQDASGRSVFLDNSAKWEGGIYANRNRLPQQQRGDRRPDDRRHVRVPEQRRR